MNSHQSFAEKYRPKTFSEIVGQNEAKQELNAFLNTFSSKEKKKGIVLHGSAGTGKTSLVLAAAKEHNLEIMELNASDLRNRAQLEERLKPATEQQSLFGKKGKILLMDEVDGVTGTDRGGIPELAKIIQTTKHPIIMTCNDIWQSKMSPIRKGSKLIEMKSPPLETITTILEKISVKEGIKENPHFLTQIAIKSQGDIRAALNDLQSYSQGDNPFVDTQEKRDVEDTIFNILRRIFKEREPFLNLFDTTSMSLDEIFLWLEENIPKEYSGETLAKAYIALGNADRFRGRIYKNQSWRFLVYQNIFQSAGISFAKSSPNDGFTKYERPKRILKIWLNNQKMAKKKTISKKYAQLVHCSAKRAMKDFGMIKPILLKPEVQDKLNLSDEEKAFLQK